MVNKDTKRRLIYAKRVFLHGREHASYNTDFDRMIAIFSFQNSIEQILRCLGEDQGVDCRYWDSFSKIITMIDAKVSASPLNKPLPMKVDIRRINSDRNRAVHDAYAPDKNQLDNYQIKTEKFFRRVLADYYPTLTFEGLSLSDLVKNDEIKSKLKECEDLMDRRAFKKCLQKLHETFEIARDIELNNLYRSKPDFLRFSFGSAFEISSKIFWDVVDYSALRIDYRELSNFYSKVFSSTDKEKNDEALKENCISCYDFIVDTVLNWEIYGIKKKIKAYFEIEGLKIHYYSITHTNDEIEIVGRIENDLKEQLSALLYNKGLCKFKEHGRKELVVIRGFTARRMTARKSGILYMLKLNRIKEPEMYVRPLWDVVIGEYRTSSGGPLIMRPIPYISVRETKTSKEAEVRVKYASGRKFMKGERIEISLGHDKTHLGGSIKLTKIFDGIVDNVSTKISAKKSHCSIKSTIKINKKNVQPRLYKIKMPLEFEYDDEQGTGVLMITGEPKIKLGDNIHLKAEHLGIDETYKISEVEHKFSSKGGYVTVLNIQG